MESHERTPRDPINDGPERATYEGAEGRRG